MKDSRRAHEKRDRHTQEDLDKLFVPSCFNRKSFKHSYCYWLPLLGLYTGARLNELCQLYLDDIRLGEEGIHILDINDQEDKRLKTPAAKRIVPIHPKLIALGLLEHVETLRKAGETRLFPELKNERDGYGQVASKWFARYRKSCGVDKDFHSFRHTFIDELKQKAVDSKIIAALVGHQDESITTGRYGKPYGDKILAEAVEKLEITLP